jgi:hypothetical protein
MVPEHPNSGSWSFHYAKVMPWQRQKVGFLLVYNSICIERGGLRATNQQQTPGAAVWFRRSSLSTRRYMVAQYVA